MYIGVPAVLNRGGVREILEVELSEDEELKFDHSVQVLKETMAPVLNMYSKSNPNYFGLLLLYFLFLIDSSLFTSSTSKKR